jgi:hypothetical protein
MYCRKCYAELDTERELHRCVKCGRAFDPADARSYLTRPFPSVPKMILFILATTIISIMGAYVVALFQEAGASGH